MPYRRRPTAFSDFSAFFRFFRFFSHTKRPTANLLQVAVPVTVSLCYALVLPTSNIGLSTPRVMGFYSTCWKSTRRYQVTELEAIPTRPVTTIINFTSMLSSIVHLKSNWSTGASPRNADRALRMSTPLHLKKVDSHTDLNFEPSLVTSSLFIMLSPSAA